jgi:hypothetical protein
MKRTLLSIVLVVVVIAVAIFAALYFNEDTDLEDDIDRATDVGAQQSDGSDRVDARPSAPAESEDVSEDASEDAGVEADSFTPPLNEGPAPPRDEWTRTGLALGPDGAAFAVSWWYEDASDPISGFSGAIDLWDVATGDKRTTVEGISGDVCGIDPGSRGCLQWHPDGDRLGFVFNTNAVGAIDTAEEQPRIVDGVGDPTGTDTGPPWTYLADGRVAVGFMADYRLLGSGRLPLSIWDIRRKRLIPVDLEADDDLRSVGSRYVSIGQNRMAGLASNQIVVASLDPAEIVDVLPQANKYAGPGGLSSHDYFNAYASEHVSPNRRWLLSREGPGVALYELPEVEIRQLLTQVDSDEHAAEFCWSPDSRKLAIVVRNRKHAQRATGRLLVFDNPTSNEARTHDDPPRTGFTGSSGFNYRDLCAFTPTGEHLALVYPGRVDVMDVASLQVERSISMDRDPFGVAVGADQTLVVWGGDTDFSREVDPWVDFYDLETGRRR